jgi:hypothetical protein
VLAFEGTDLSPETIAFESALWRTVHDVRERADIYRFLTFATEQVCAAGLLPRPREQLAPFGGSATGRWITRFAPVMIRRRCRDLRAALIK